jgi:hypothetical protein
MWVVNLNNILRQRMAPVLPLPLDTDISRVD